MAATLAGLLASLDLEDLGGDAFLGRCPPAGWSRIFGGLVVAQALAAAARTAGGRPVHALQGVFALPGDPGAPLSYRVERFRDGRSFTTRRCTAWQHDWPIFALTASFHAPEAGGFEHAATPPDVPGPDDLPSPADVRMGRVPGLPAPVRAYFGRDAPIELRPVDLGRFAMPPAGGTGARESLVWMRAASPLPDDPALHTALLAYMSDMMLLDATLVPQGRTVFDRSVQTASLDHAIWFHRPVRADGWLLHAADSPAASGGLGLARATIFDRTGAPVASTAQQGLIRPLTAGMPKK